MSKSDPFKGLHGGPDVIRLAVMMCNRFPLSLRKVEDLRHERGIDVSHETVRSWWIRFGPMFSAAIKRKRVDWMRAFRRMRYPQKVAAVHTSACNFFNRERHLCSRRNLKLNRTAALEERRRLCSA